jgi:hypothetical protein
MCSFDEIQESPLFGLSFDLKLITQNLQLNFAVPHSLALSFEGPNLRVRSSGPARRHVGFDENPKSRHSLARLLGRRQPRTPVQFRFDL